MHDHWRADFAETPPFQHLRERALALAGNTWPDLDTLNALAQAQGLINAAHQPLRFVEQTQRCGQHAYESGIFTSGRVPTRVQNWHDLLNALSWLALPATKSVLNAVQCNTLQAHPSQRSPLADAATLFDESGLVMAGPDASLADDLRAHRWHEVFWTRRADWRDVSVFVVGHAVLEKLLQPWPAITAKCVFLSLPPRASLQAVDAALAQHWLGEAVTRPADLFPVPVLGIPGWWKENETPAFYDDTAIFRPAPSSLSGMH